MQAHKLYGLTQALLKPLHDKPATTVTTLWAQGRPYERSNFLHADVKALIAQLSPMDHRAMLKSLKSFALLVGSLQPALLQAHGSLSCRQEPAKARAQADPAAAAVQAKEKAYVQPEHAFDPNASSAWPVPSHLWPTILECLTGVCACLCIDKAGSCRQLTIAVLCRHQRPVP